MSKIIIWHNQECSKSRMALSLLEEKKLDIKVIDYLEKAPSKEEIVVLLKMLHISARALMRTKEEIYTTLNLQEETEEVKLIEAMHIHPILIERPIIIKEDKAVIARPFENLVELLK